MQMWLRMHAECASRAHQLPVHAHVSQEWLAIGNNLRDLGEVLPLDAQDWFAVRCLLLPSEAVALAHWFKCCQGWCLVPPLDAHDGVLLAARFNRSSHAALLCKRWRCCCCWRRLCLPVPALN